MNASHMIRIVMSLLILFFLNVSLFYKYLLVNFMDFIDSRPRNSNTLIHPLMSNSEYDPNDINYQIKDKIIDSIISFILLLYLLKKNYLPKKQNNILIFLFVFRMIGIYLFIQNKDRSFLIYFPNFFMEIMLLFIAMKEFFNSCKVFTFICCLHLADETVTRNVSTRVNFLFIAVVNLFLNFQKLHKKIIIFLKLNNCACCFVNCKIISKFSK